VRGDQRSFLLFVGHSQQVRRNREGGEKKGKKSLLMNLFCIRKGQEDRRKGKGEKGKKPLVDYLRPFKRRRGEGRRKGREGKRKGSLITSVEREILGRKRNKKKGPRSLPLGSRVGGEKKKGRTGTLLSI